MTKQLPTRFSGTSAGELKHLIPWVGLLPDESPADYEGLKDALMDDLAPVSPYEQVLADQLVGLIWEMYRHRRMRNALIRNKFRDFTIAVLATGEIKELIRCDYTSEHRDLATAFVDQDRENMRGVLAAFAEHNIEAQEICAAAYSAVAGKLETHEKALASLETRRRRLGEDYERLKAARRTPVEDAEIVE